MTQRREFLRTIASAAMAASSFPLMTTARELNTLARPLKRSIRIAHITDVHLLQQANATQLFRRVLEEINGMKDKPDFIINTGDSIMEGNGQTPQTVGSHWSAWKSVVTSSNKLDLYHALGNHDVWHGADSATDNEYRKDKRYGKAWAMDMLGLSKRYYSFSSRGWKFIALDSINGTAGYVLDDEQFEWLEKETADTTQPILVFSHVPILSIGALLYYTKRKPLKEVRFPSGDMHDDHQRIKELFLNRRNVKVCLSGHVHYIDAIEYLGVKYLCNGAVSGNWWGTPLQLDEFPPAYAIVDLFEDGTSGAYLVHYDLRI
jgi:3',5'-cyclic-AMP phosphodiesterase